MREPAAFAVGVEPALGDFAVNIGISDGKQGKLRAKSVPQAGVGVGWPRLERAVPGAVMNHLAARVPFVDFAGILQRAIKARVERLFALSASVYRDAAHQFFPRFGGGLTNALEPRSGLAVQIDLRLLRTNETGGDSHFQRPAVLGCELDVSGALARRGWGSDALAAGDEMIEDALEVTVEVSRRRAAVILGVAPNAVALHLELGLARQFKDQPTDFVRRGEINAPHRRPLGRG